MSDFEPLPATHAVLKQGAETGLHLGVQIYVSLNGETIVDAGFGKSAPGMEMSRDTINLWLSAGKPLTAVMLAILQERGELQLSDPLSKFLPEWKVASQLEVSLAQLLTHTAGIPNMELNWPPTDAALIQSIISTPVDPELNAAYNTAASWFLLGEVIERLTDMPFHQALRTLLCEPAGMPKTYNGMTAETYEKASPQLGHTFESSRKTGLIDLDWHRAERVCPSAPGGNTRGPIRELGRFYELLLSGGGDVLSADSVSELTARHREGLFDETFQHKIDWGLGFILNSNQYGEKTLPYRFSRFSSPNTFGHGGAQSAMGFADPARKLVVSWIANGRPGEPRHNQRNRELNDAIYTDLGFDTLQQ